MTDRDGSSQNWPVLRLEHIRPARDDASTQSIEVYESDSSAAHTRPAHLVVLSWISELRRRWKLATLATLAVLVPVAGYAVTAVPTYSAEGALQVSAQGGSMNPLLELAGAGGASQVETEVEIIRRREFVLGVLKDLRLNVVDPQQASRVTTDLAVSLGGASPVRSELRSCRAALAVVEVGPDVFGKVPFAVTSLDGDRIAVRVGKPEDAREHEIAVGERLHDPALELEFAALPTEIGQTLELEAVSDGALYEEAVQNLRVASMGTARQATNLVSVRYTDPDRETARAVVQAMMQRYLDQSLRWQAMSASNAAEFIEKQLEDAKAQLHDHEGELREFAEQERAVQLDKQAEVTISSSAEVEAEKRKIELQERVIGAVLESMRRQGPNVNADLTSNFFDDPVLAANVAALTDAETKFAVLKATMTPEHPELKALDEQIRLRRIEVERLLKSARKNLSTQRAELERTLETAMSSLSSYPEKELQLARHMRDVEVSQRLYAFLLEKYQEAEILKASTTTDKRIVDAANLPHKMASPARAKLVASGWLGAMLFAFACVYLAHLLQRKIGTVEAVKHALPFAVYGTIPNVVDAKAGAKKSAGDRLRPAAIWTDAHGPAAEAFRALAVNVSLSPMAPRRGRIVQVTSSQPGEGKSTVISNLAVALAKTGARVLLIDLDLRKPVQHRNWNLKRKPGYSDALAQGGGPKRAGSLLQHNKAFGLDIMTAGSKLPDTLSAVMSDTLESMLASWAEQYDYVLIDSPPAFVADTALLARHADLMLVVAFPGVVERGNARYALESLGRVNVPRGLVLNGVERKHAEYYYGGGGYYYAAQAYGTSAEDDDKQVAS